MAEKDIAQTAVNEVDAAFEDNLNYYEEEAKNVPIFGSVREISLAENVIKVLPKSFETAIDIGCGDGYLLHEIKKEFSDAQLYGLDLTQGRILTTKQNVPSSHLLRADIVSLPFPDNAFDVVICSELLEHLTNYKEAIDELIRITKKKLILTVPNELRLVHVLCPKCKTRHYVDGHVVFFTDAKLKEPFVGRKDMVISNVRKFHTIFTYNRLTMKLPVFFRMFLEQTIILAHRTITFLKPNFLLVAVEKKNVDKSVVNKKGTRGE
jgi:ubiquinone/menaquinone biosynthesis C-methylase UbiE